MSYSYIAFLINISVSTKLTSFSDIGVPKRVKISYITTL